MNKTKIFHELHHGDQPLILPNAWDFGSAAMLAAEGFPAIGTTSLGVAVAAGLPDRSQRARFSTEPVSFRPSRRFPPGRRLAGATEVVLDVAEGGDLEGKVRSADARACEVLDD